jgi:hypothetical protein
MLDLETTLQNLAFFRCIHENFMDGCGNFILQSVSSKRQLKNSNKESVKVIEDNAKNSAS